MLGIGWLGATLVAMLVLSWGKKITGKQLKNRVLMTEAQVTLMDAYLALAVLIGLVLNAITGWGWADPVAGLVIVNYGIKKGKEAFASSSYAS